MKQVGHLNGLKNGDLIDQPNTVGVELLPFPSAVDVQSAALSLVSKNRDGGEDRISASLGPAQMREIAARLLMLADAAGQGAQRTIMLVTTASSWIPGQALTITSGANNAFDFRFALSSKLAVPEKQKLILPA